MYGLTVLGTKPSCARDATKRQSIPSLVGNGSEIPYFTQNEV